MNVFALSSIGVLLAVLPLLYVYTCSVAQTYFPTVRNKRICLLIAHPDDEAMFFAPAVLALTRPETGNHVKILCLSTGDADGLGETRKKELVKSAMLLGLRQEDDVFVIDSPYVQYPTVSDPAESVYQSLISFSTSSGGDNTDTILR